MNAIEYINSLGLKNETRIPMAKYLYPSIIGDNFVEWEKLCNLLREIDVEPFNFDDSPFELMGIVNRMSKSPTMPQNLKNRFYVYKHRIINKCLEDKRISDIFDEENCYSVVIDNTYKFHTLKLYYPNGLKCDGIRKKKCKYYPSRF